MKKNLTIYMLLFLLVIQIADLFRFFDKFNPFVPVELVFPPAKIAQQLKNVSGVNRYFSYENAYVEANFDTQLNLYSPNGYDPLYPKSYGEFIHLSLDGTLANAFGITTRSDAVVSQDVNRNSLKVLNLLGVAYILNRPALTWKISSNKDAFPRAFMGSDYKLYKSQSEFEKLFASVDLKKTILLSEKPTLNFKQAKDPKVSFVSYSPDQIVLNTTSKQNQLLFISDSYYPGWKAYVDGLETRIYKADYAFRTIAVPRGNHKVIFVYDPKSFEIGKWITLISFITFAVFALFLRYNKNR